MGEIPQPTQNVIVSGQLHDKETTKWMLMYDDLLDAFYHDMKHEVKVTDGKAIRWITNNPDAKPFLNEEGTLYIISMLRDPTSKNTLMGNISEAEAYKFALSISDAVAKGLFLNQEDFGMETTTWPFIMEKIRDIVFFALTRPIGGEERKKFHESRSVTEVTSNRPVEQKSSGGWNLGPLKLFGGR
ncbi:MAG: hypothetical protein Sv326_0449 [Candidatus Fermentimicrarchaeum limneticum]|uniref:Uncharacterized protein n=1 Tax=Fermentimicrarchaeum limneticum TaxID=2795018 RepID=A0A7D6BUS4_FERL1|nr:MAG: hypothetical protein Sv326_0375 [Candidatus Fermentimicrarchaeum limneticum]QLJ52587.1 MAG: hypothetical protein Sv326_0412 [Candidatus Fermentimicrarchaeum limneticum]QLJ52624.1 MAG: hypothetical protein Sv326_0449 [Candidatus Fermentimicrarchaeum limneticum]